MTPLRRFATGILPICTFAACAQLIGLSDYEKGEEPSNGEGGEENGGADSGGTAGSGKGGSGGTAGSRPTGGRSGQGGTDGGDGGEGDVGGVGGDGGQSGSDTGGTRTGGRGGMSTGGQAGTMAGSGGAMAGTAGSAGSPPCTEVTAMTLIDQVIDRSEAIHYASFVFQISPGIGLSSTVDHIDFQFWNGGAYDGILTGTFNLGTGRDSNNSTCSRCLVGTQDPDAASSLQKTFFQTSGTITIADTSQQLDGFPNFSYSDVTLREATIDENDLHSTIVPGGACLHFASGSFVLPPEWSCPSSWQGDLECDCGCGILDIDCTSAEATACEACWCDDSGDCTGLESPTKNYMCL